MRFHDPRATAITRMPRAGLRESEGMKISWHSQYKTFLKNVHRNASGTQIAGGFLDVYLDNPAQK